MKKLHNNPEKQPTGQCSVKELAQKLLDLNISEELNFSENPEGSDYWGSKSLKVFEQRIILFGYYGGPGFQLYHTGRDILADMVRHPGYHLNKKEEDIIYTFDIIMPKPEVISKENIVSSYFFYMWNAWCKEECDVIFGWESNHFWDKWCGICERYSVYVAAEKIYAELSTESRTKLVDRACKIYDGSKGRKENV